MRSFLTRRQVDWITMTFGLCVFTPKTASGLSQTAKAEMWTTAYAILFIFIFELGGSFLSRSTLRLFEIALVLVRFNHVASVIVNADHSIMSTSS